MLDLFGAPGRIRTLRRRLWINKHMKQCPKCNQHHQKPGVYCSRGCANSRSWSEEDKIKKSISAKTSVRVKLKNSLQTHNRGFWGQHKNRIGPCSPIWFKYCSHCNSLFSTNKEWKVCCSKECRYQRSTFNNVKKTRIEYQCYDGSIIQLHSQWEVKIAEILDNLGYCWSRPISPLIWIDNKNKKRRYTPDFYLKDFSIFLDVKNPLKIEQDKEKLTLIQNQYPVVVLTLTEMIAYLEDLS